MVTAAISKGTLDLNCALSAHFKNLKWVLLLLFHFTSTFYNCHLSFFSLKRERKTRPNQSPLTCLPSFQLFLFPFFPQLFSLFIWAPGGFLCRFQGLIFRAATSLLYTDNDRLHTALACSQLSIILICETRSKMVTASVRECWAQAHACE